MSLIRPQGNKKVRKIKKRGVREDIGSFPILLDEKESIWDLTNNYSLILDGQKPLFILHDPNQYDFVVVSHEPITEESINKALEEEKEKD